MGRVASAPRRAARRFPGGAAHATIAAIVTVLAAIVWGLYLAALGGLAVSALHGLSLVVRARRRLPPVPPCDPAALPVVTVQLPIFNEQAVAARVTAAACVLDWPRDPLEIQVLDDSTDATRALCAAEVAAWRARGVDIVHLYSFITY